MKFKITLVMAVLMAFTAFTAGNVNAQTAVPPAPTGITAANSSETGQVIVSWDAVDAAAFYRIGWVAFPDYQETVDDGRDWLEAFHFVDVANNGQTQWTLTRLSPGVQYYFIVASNDNRNGVPQYGNWSNFLSLTPGPPASPVDYVGARISLSDVDNTRGYRLTVAGAGFSNGATATVYVLNRPPTYAEKIRNEGACQAVVAEGIAAGSARVGADGNVAITFEVTEPMFKAGRVNHICATDSTGRAAVWDVEVFELEISLVSMYPNCDAVRAHYPGGVRVGSPIYRPALDSDGDGIACEPTSSVPTSDSLPIQTVGTFTGAGDNADNVIRLETGLHRVTSIHSNGTSNFIVRLEGVSSDDRELLANEIGVARVVDTVRVGTGFLQNEPGNYLLTVQADGDWEIKIELIGGN